MAAPLRLTRERISSRKLHNVKTAINDASREKRRGTSGRREWKAKPRASPQAKVQTEMEYQVCPRKIIPSGPVCPLQAYCSPPFAFLPHHRPRRRLQRAREFVCSVLFGPKNFVSLGCVPVPTHRTYHFPLLFPPNFTVRRS